MRVKLVLIGETGIGKSQLGNFIIQEKGTFKVGYTKDSETQDIISHCKTRDNAIITVVDTPGFNDTNDDDETILKKIFHFFKGSNDIDGIGYVYSYCKARKTKKDQELLINLIEIFGKEVLNKRLFNIVTYAPNEEDIDEEENKKINRQKEDITSLMRSKLGNDFVPKFFFVNTKYTEKYLQMYQPVISQLINNIIEIKKKFGSMNNEKISLENTRIYNAKKQKLDEITVRKERVNNEIDDKQYQIRRKREYIDEQKRKAKSGKAKFIIGLCLLPLLPASIPLMAVGDSEIKQANREISSLESDLDYLYRQKNELENKYNRLYNEFRALC